VLLSELDVFFDESTAVVFCFSVSLLLLADLFFSDTSSNLVWEFSYFFNDLEEEFDLKSSSIMVLFNSVVILAFIAEKFVGIYSPS